MPTQTFKVGEMLNKRSPFSKTWINFDGSYTTEVYQSPVHYDDEDGNLHNIDTTLFDEADLNDYAGPIGKHGKIALQDAKERARSAKKTNKLDRDNFDYQGLSVPFEAKLPKNFKRGYGIGRGANRLRFKPVGASPSKGHLDEEHKNRVQYQDAWNDADVLLELTPNGIKETIILKTDKAPTQYSFEVFGPIRDDLAAGDLKLAPAWLEDATGEKRDVSQTIRREGENAFIDLSADVEGLTYPIAIDPTVNIQPDATAGKDAFIDSFAPTVNYGSHQSLFVGNDSGGAAYRSLLEFSLATIPTGAIVTAGTLTLNGQGSNNSSLSLTLQVYRATQSWSELNVSWSTQPQVATTASASLIVGSVTTASTHTFDIRQLISDWVNGVYPNYGIHIRDSAENGTVYKEFNSSDFATVGDRPKLTVTYNTAPTTPTLTSPNGGQTWNSTHTITWLAATDSESSQSTLRYHIQLTTNNGASWKDIVALTSMGATSYSYNFINEAETSTAKIRVRAHDGSTYSPWDESDGVFTIQHNVAPAAPTNLTPVNVFRDRAITISFDWDHNDTNGTDPQSKFDLQWRLQGSGTWNTVTQTTPNNYYIMPANTLPVGAIEWQVRTYDQAGLSGPYSSAVVFNAADKTATPTLITPTDNTTVAVPRPVIQWSHPNQVEYLLELWDSTEENLLWSDQKTSTNKAVTVGIDLQNQQDYLIYVFVRDSGGVWSNVAFANIHVSFTPPDKPLITTTQNDVEGFVTVSVANATPTGTQPTVTINQVFRRETPSDTWVKIAEIPANASFTDYEPKPLTGLSYAVTAFGANGTYAESDVKYLSDGVNVEQTKLMLVSDPTKVVTMIKGARLSKRNRRESEQMAFAGRENPVTEFGEQRERDFDFKYLVSEWQHVEMIELLADAGEVLLLRDNIGRKEYVTLNEVTYEEGPTHWEISVKPQKVSYVEGV